MKSIDYLVKKADEFLSLAASSEKNRQRALEFAKRKNQFGRPVYTEEERQSGIAGRNTYDFTTISLEGLIQHLTEKLATQRSALKQKIETKLIKARRDPNALKLYLDEIGKAATKKNKPALLKAVKMFREKLVEYRDVQPESVEYLLNVRSSKFFYAFRDHVKVTSKFVKSPQLSVEELKMIESTASEGKELARYYRNLEIKTLDEGVIKTNYATIISIIDLIVNQLIAALEQSTAKPKKPTLPISAKPPFHRQLIKLLIKIKEHFYTLSQLNEPTVHALKSVVNEISSSIENGSLNVPGNGVGAGLASKMSQVINSVSDNPHFHYTLPVMKEIENQLKTYA